MRHLLTGFEFSQDEYLDILDTAAAMKQDPKKFNQVLAGRSGAIMFEKPSLRTRTTFELAFYRLGGHGVYLDLQNGDYITAYKLDFSGDIIEKYTGVIGEPTSSMSRKTANMEVRTNI